MHEKKNLDSAIAKVTKMEANLGGTNIFNPLDNVFSEPIIPGYPKNIIVLTDGAVRNTNDVLKLV